MKNKSESFVNQNRLIKKGLKDIFAGKVSSHEEVTNRFAKKLKKNQ